jgi:hypothetical protein
MFTRHGVMVLVACNTVYSEIRRNAQANPYDVLDISRLMAIPSDHPPSSIPPSQSEDCFMLFPWEILEGTADFLPSTDADPPSSLKVIRPYSGKSEFLGIEIRARPRARLCL